MTTQHELEVYRALREAQTRYTYFLLAAVGAAIALTINQTQNMPLKTSLLLLAFAVGAWLLSFVAGCLHLSYSASILYANGDLLKVQSGTHPSVGAHPQLMEAAVDGIRSAIEKNNIRSQLYAKLQFVLLVLGAVAYLAWHVLEMYLRTAEAI